MGVFPARVNLELGHHMICEGVLGEHSLHGLAQDLFRVAFAHLLGADPLDPPREPGMPPIDLFLFLLPYIYPLLLILCDLLLSFYHLKLLKWLNIYTYPIYLI